MTWYHPALAQRALDADSREIAALKVENERLRTVLKTIQNLPQGDAGFCREIAREGLANQPLRGK